MLQNTPSCKEKLDKYGALVAAVPVAMSGKLRLMQAVVKESKP